MSRPLFSKVEYNLRKIYVISSLRWMMFIMPVLVLFFQENGLSMRQVMILQAFFSVSIIVFEIPSGYFSDIVGRKTTLVIGIGFGFAGFAIYSISSGFWGFLAAELALGLGASFISGTDSALIYDSLIETGQQEFYTKFEGRKQAMCNFSEATASILGGLLATISLRTPLYLETAFNFAALLLALTLVEPQRHKFDASKAGFSDILRVVKFSLHDQREIKWLILYSAIVGSSTLTMVWFIQPFLKEAGLPLKYFGVVWALLNASVGVFSVFAHRIESAWGRQKTLISLIVLIAMGYLSIALVNSLWAVPFLFLFYFVRGINIPVLKDYINRLISSDRRATVLSVQGLMGRLLFAAVGPLVGWIKDIYSLPAALAISGGTFLLLGIVALIFLHRNRVLKAS